MDKTRIRPSKSEVKKLICDNKKANKILNWTPQYDLKKGLEKTITWISNHIDCYKSNIYNQ